VTVNLSARQFASPELVTLTANALEKTGLEPSRLGLELTESALMEEADSPVETLRLLKGLGVKLLLDDFGTGYSSLSYLQRFPIDTLKVDRSFVAALDSHEGHGVEVLAAVAALAGALDLDCVAEGVETQRELDVLVGLGYRLAQGYFFARPMSAGDLAILLSQQRLSCLAGPANAVFAGAEHAAIAVNRS
jgi:EAL domain-containing protein (putative c-di-GMP-specific phosphodiesterase class I)